MLKTTLPLNNETYTLDLTSGIDISIPIGRQEGPNAFHLTKAQYQVVEAPGFTGSVARGGSCNCENIFFNPHGDGTHTECAGHVAAEKIYINNVLKQFFFTARLITLTPSSRVEGRIIEPYQVKKALAEEHSPFDAIIIRTLPNPSSKKTRDYSGTNAPYFDVRCMDYFNSIGIKHILTDLPSLDKEDDGELKAHKAFFGYPQQWNLEKTVTEMIFVPDEVKDGSYLLNLQISSFESDASPSKPVLYRLEG
jgi:arylformamidase